MAPVVLRCIRVADAIEMIEGMAEGVLDCESMQPIPFAVFLSPFEACCGEPPKGCIGDELMAVRAIAVWITLPQLSKGNDLLGC